MGTGLSREDRTLSDAHARPTSLTRPVLSLIGGLGLLFAMVFAAVLVTVTAVHGENQSARRSSRVLAASLDAERRVVDLETGMRGYLLTHEGQLLAPYYAAQTSLPQELATLRRLAAGHVEQQRVSQLSSAISRYIHTYLDPLVASSRRLTPAQQIAATARGKQLLDTLRSRFTVLDDTEQRLGARQRQAANRDVTAAIILSAVGVVTTILLLAALAVYLFRGVLAPMRAVAGAATKLGGGDLSVRVPEHGRGEVGQLATAFNGLATAVETRDHELAAANARMQAAAEEARKASGLKSSFLANMSHEIRTPLNGVMGMMTLLSETSLTAEQREYLATARISGEALLAVINDILDFSKIEAGRLDIEPLDFDVREAVEATCEIVAQTARDKGIELHAFVEAEVPLFVRADRVRMSQVLTNLLSNAVKFTERGHVTVNVSVREATEADATLCFEVSDTGIGIAPKHLERLFESFTQGDASTTRRFGGTGLGLSISRELVRLMGGEIGVESEPGRGSRFHFSLPVQMAAEPAAASLVHVDLDGTRLLIVEPERSNHRVLQAYATAWGMRPACVENAADAITAIQDAARSGEPFDVALIDFDLPDRSGADLARQIRSTPALRGTRLIILAGTGEEHARARAAGAQESVTKPIRRSRLLEAITTVMRPAAMARHALVETQPQPAPAQEPSKARILVAEDQPINQLVIQRLLAHRGYNAECVGDGREVLARLEVEEYDLIFMDCQMPGLDGYETTREIRRRETEAGKHIPVVALTGHALEGDRQQCIAAGMDDYLAKPLRQEQLYEVLERWLPAEPEAREPVLDGSRIAELRGSFTREEMAGLLERFCANMPEVLDQLEHAVARADAAAIKSGAHRILGTASAVGARSMAALAAKLEQDARAYLDYETHTGGTDRLDATDPTIVSELRARWALTAEAIQREIGKLAQPVHAGVA